MTGSPFLLLSIYYNHSFTIFSCSLCPSVISQPPATTSLVAQRTRQPGLLVHLYTSILASLPPLSLPLPLIPLVFETDLLHSPGWLGAHSIDRAEHFILFKTEQYFSVYVYITLCYLFIRSLSLAVGNSESMSV